MVRQTLRPAKQDYTQVDENLFREQITNFMNEIDNRVTNIAVSYTHLTLPTKRIV